MQDYYRLLEVHPDASTEVIHKAYRTLVRQYHPDTFHMSDKSRLEEQMKQLNRAYETLADPKLRADYDKSYKTYQQRVSETAVKNQWMANLQKIAYWVLLAAFIGFAGRAGLRLIMMLPLLPKLLVIIAIVWGVRSVWKHFKEKRLW